MNRRHALQLLGAVAIGGVAGCLGGPNGSTPVEMVGLRFEPRAVTVDVGETVEWVNDSDVSHTVTAYESRLPSGAAYFASGGFESERAAQQNVGVGLIAPDGSFTHTFETAGEHPYYCIPHEGSGMTGTVAVG